MTHGSSDVVVVGAGPAGSTCATLLARSGRRVTLVDDGGAGPFRPPEILSPHTRRRLREHGLTAAETTPGAAACLGVEGRWTGGIDFFDYALMACEPALAVDRSELDAILVKGAIVAGGTLCQGRVTSAAITDAWQVDVLQGRDRVTLTAAVLVDAVGRRRSVVSRDSGRLYYDKLCGLALPLQHPASDTTTMILEAGIGGWWYLSRDARGRGAVVFMTDTDLLPRGQQARSEAFLRELATTGLISSHIGPLPPELKLHGLDARTSRRAVLEMPKAVVIGDAAYSVDPLSGAGIQRCVETAAAAASAVDRYLSGNSGALREYARWASEDFDRWLSRKDQVYADVETPGERGAFWRRRFEQLPADGAWG